ncbi:MAG: phosphoribosylformimino-5-aminoimidazole carboxamide ribotide isomerase [Lachnospiraceae bacterium]|nr:phosphoribosylformimino-5-aminoimidazole carboxamide ribotide isomerase [Lachnospiraceae bacterium]
MKFRPCIDIHDGAVKQIVGSTLSDDILDLSENFVSSKGSAWYAKKYKEDGIKGAHVIILNSTTSPLRKDSEEEAIRALKAYPGGLQIGGGITAENAQSFIEAGASHIIVTSYAFADGKIKYDNLNKLIDAVGKEHIVLDLSCRAKDGKYYVVTDRWQKFTEEEVNEKLFVTLSMFCDEFLVHGVDVEGKGQGVDETLIKILAKAQRLCDLPITYAGGISSYDDIKLINEASDSRLCFTIGTKLDLFGGNIEYDYVKSM